MRRWQWHWLLLHCILLIGFIFTLPYLPEKFKVTLHFGIISKHYSYSSLHQTVLVIAESPNKRSRLDDVENVEVEHMSERQEGTKKGKKKKKKYFLTLCGGGGAALQVQSLQTAHFL